MRQTLLYYTRYLSDKVTSRKFAIDQTGISSEFTKDITNVCLDDRACAQRDNVNSATGCVFRMWCTIFPSNPAGNTMSNSKSNNDHLDMSKCMINLALNQKYWHENEKKYQRDVSVLVN